MLYIYFQAFRDYFLYKGQIVEGQVIIHSLLHQTQPYFTRLICANLQELPGAPRPPAALLWQICPAKQLGGLFPATLI